MRYEIQQRAERQYVVFDIQAQTYTRGRFHTRADAQEWIDTQEAKRIMTLVFPQTSMPGRAKAYLLTDPDFAGTNERNILTVIKRLFR